VRVQSLAVALALAHALTLASCSPARDVIPESRDVRGVVPERSAPSALQGAPQKDGYTLIARRAHGVVGLVGAHFMTDEDARHILERVADDLEACAARLEPRGELVEGALSLVAVTGPRGNAEVTDVRFAPGGPVAANALACVIAPLRASTFPAASDRGLPALALDATWAPVRARPAAASDAGSGGPL
jgi:hypothetical protein